MAVSIVQTVFTDTDKGISLGNNELMRPFSFNNNWTAIRIGTLMNMTPDGTNNLTGSTLFFGVCVNPRGYTNSQSFAIGMQNGSGAFTYNAGAGNPYFSNAGWVAASKINGVATTGGAFGASIADTTSPARRQLVIFEITKTSATGFSSRFYNGVTTADFTYNQLISAMEQSGTTISVGGATLTTGTTTHSVSAGDQAANMALCDALSISWNRETLPVYLYSLVIQRIS